MVAFRTHRPIMLVQPQDEPYVQSSLYCDETMQKVKSAPVDMKVSEEEQLRKMMYAVARTSVANETKATRAPLPLKMRKPWRR